jgi:hypothetical protein
MPQRHRSEISECVSADPLGRLRRTPRTYGQGRHCAFPGCGTVLSIYNGAKCCGAHSPIDLRAAVARESRPSAAVSTVTAAAPMSDEPPVARRARPQAAVLVEPGGRISRRAS